MGDVDSPQRLIELVQRHGLQPADVTVELTETAIAAEHGRLLESLVRLRMAGFGVALDDFGTGFSSLQQLSCSPFTELKIDRSFVTGAAVAPRKLAILEWIVGLARTLKMRVVAEGIETEADLALVSELQAGQGQGQGFLAAPPLPAEEFLQWCTDFSGWPAGLRTRPLARAA